MGKGSGDGRYCCYVINFKGVLLQESMLPYVFLVSLESWRHWWQCDYNRLILFFNSGYKQEQLSVSQIFISRTSSIRSGLPPDLTCVKTLSKELQISL